VPGRLLRRFAGVLLAWCSLASAQVQEAPPSPKFDIQRFEVVGNTLLPVDQVQRIVGPFTGKNRDFGTVQQALEALQEAYLSGGYNAVRVFVPEQDLDKGQVRLQVIESRMRSVRVENNKFFDEANIRHGLPSLRAGEAPNTRRIGENVSLTNENPAKQVLVRLEPTDNINQVDAVARVTDESPNRISVTLDNTGNSSTGQMRLGVGYQNANVGNSDQVFTIQYLTSPDHIKDVSIFGVGYRIPKYDWNGVFDLFAGYSDVNSGTVQNLFNVTGSGTIAGARYTQILPRVDQFEQKVAFGVDYRAFQQNVALVGTTESLVPDITVTPISLSYLGRVSRPGSDLSFSVGVSHNIPAGGDGDQAAFDAQRAGAKARYTILRAGAAYSTLMPGDLLFRFTFSGQETQDLLVPGEQFGMGGQDSVRGFTEREVANDYGHRASVELYSPDFGSRLGNNGRARLLTFFDTARGHDNAPIRSEKNGLSSTGLGVRISQGKSLFLRADWGYVTNGTVTRAQGNDRWHLGIGYSF
jgi:hemolysin activation/secretion protein